MFTKSLILSFLFTFKNTQSTNLQTPPILSYQQSSQELLTRVQTDDSVKYWAQLIKTLIDSNLNVSIIAWQNVYNNGSEIEEVVAVELTFPCKEEKKSDIFEEIKKDVLKHGSRDVQFDLVTRFERFREYEKVGFLVDNFVEYSMEDVPSFLFYQNLNTTYLRLEDNLVTFNKTQAATKEQVETFLDELKEKDFYLKLLWVTYDSNMTMVHNKTSITGPSAVAYVVDSWNAFDELLMWAPNTFAVFFLMEKPEDFSKELTKAFDDKFPLYDWRILIHPGKYQLMVDVWIKMSTDGYDFYEKKDDIYFIYGVLK